MAVTSGIDRLDRGAEHGLVLWLAAASLSIA